MNDLVESRLREIFADDAGQAPAPRDLAHQARLKASRQRGARLAVIASAAVVLATVASVGFAATRSGSTPSSKPVSDSSPTPTPPASSGTELRALPDSSSALYYRNVEIPVPAAMLVSGTGTVCLGDRDAAYVFDPRIFRAVCSVHPKHPAALTTVVVQPIFNGPEGQHLSPRPPPSGTRKLADGRTQVTSAIPGGDLKLIVTSPDAVLADRLFGGLRIIDQVHGCPVRDDRSAMDPLPAAGTVVRASACAYQDGWLVASADFDQANSRTLLDLRRAELSPPQGSSTGAVPVTCPSPSSKPFVEYWSLRFHTADGGERVQTRGMDACESDALQGALFRVGVAPAYSGPPPG